MPRIKGWGKLIVSDGIIYVNKIPPWKVDSYGGVSSIDIYNTGYKTGEKWIVKMVKIGDDDYYSFKTKKQALKFAINWMKKHSRG